MNVTHRLKAFIAYCGVSVAAFETVVESSGSIQAAIQNNRSGFQTKLIEKISNKYPNLNLNWLIAGRGAMLMDGQIAAMPLVPVAGGAGELLAENVELLRENRQLRIVIEKLREGEKEG